MAQLFQLFTHMEPVTAGERGAQPEMASAERQAEKESKMERERERETERWMEHGRE